MVDSNGNGSGPDAKQGEKKTTNGQVHKKESFWKTRLDTSDALFSPPWQSIMNYALMGVGMLLFLPFVFQLIFVLVIKRPEAQKYLKEKHFNDLSTFRIVASMFVPWGICLGMVCSATFFSVAMCTSKKGRQTADGWLLTTFERFCRGVTVTGRRDLNKNFRLMVFVMVVTVAPLMAWHSPLAWWKAAAGGYRACSTTCHSAEAENATLCDKVGVNDGSDDVGESDAECFRLFKEMHNTTYISTMISQKKTFLTFEAILRQAHSISILDIYGSLMGAFICIVVVSAKMALRQKARMLATLKFQYVRDNMVSTHEELQTYRALFQAGCQWEEKEESLCWSLTLLGNMEKKLYLEAPSLAPNKKNKACNDAFNLSCRNDVTDDQEPFCSDVAEDTRIVFLTFFFALVDTLIPWSSRWWQTSGRQPPDAAGEFRHIVLFNAFVTFVSDMTTFGFLLAAYSRHKGEVQKVIAFDCLWRFPKEDPLHTVTRDTELLINVHSDEWEGYQGGDFTQDTMDKVRQKQLGRWFHLRQYIQLEGVDERVSMEVATTVALLMLVPRFTIFAVNLLVMDAHFWAECAVNLQLLWAMACTLGVTIQSLTVTLNLNDLFERHLHRLELLLEDTRLKRTLNSEEVPKDAEGAATQPDIVCTVETILDVLRKSDVPSTMFGISVNRKMIAGYVALTAASCVPQGVVILQNFFNELTGAL